LTRLTVTAATHSVTTSIDLQTRSSAFADRLRDITEYFAKSLKVIRNDTLE